MASIADCFYRHNQIKQDTERGVYIMSFCIAPFVKINHDLTGTYRPCDVHSEYQGDYSSAEQAFYSDEVELTRIEMIHGKHRIECSHCYDMEKVGIVSRRQHLNSIYADEVNQIKKNSETRFPIMDLEMSFDNICNFKCVTCSPTFSSQWEKELGPVKKSIQNLDANTVKNLKHLTLLGGEPFLNKRVYDNDFFKIMNENYNFENSLLVLYTNNSIELKKHWYNLLIKVKKLCVMLSLDGIEEVGEYVRYGFNQKIFDKNLRIWKNFYNKPKIEILKNIYTGVNISFLVHNMNILNIKKTQDKYDIPVILQSINSPRYLNPAILPDTIKEKIISINDDEFVVNLLNSDTYDEKECKNFIEYTTYLIKTRGKPPEECLFIYKLLCKLYPTV